ncbi:MAG: hypothetical protein LBE18_09960, partial [Planctomycetaceae bacterium]|nr:hypothetical protein [Planctomycetaceae bacterium]
MNNMKNNWVIFLLFVFGLFESVLHAESLDVLLSAKCYPTNCQVGDTIYFTFEAYNPNDEQVSYKHEFIAPGLRTVCVALVGSDDQKLLHLPFETPYYTECNRIVLSEVKLMPKERKVIGTYSLPVPSLEDLHSQKWQEELSKLLTDQKQLCFKLVFTEINPDQMRVMPLNTNKGTRKLTNYEWYFELKQRKQEEMRLLKDWHEKTPKHLLPIMREELLSSGWTSDKIYFKTSEAYHKELFSSVEPHVTILKYILRVGNRYPGYPNMPNDCQGWKKLEESFEPSTLQDEIRWTRICLQYCTTADAKVLDELKTWLEKMNPIQR